MGSTVINVTNTVLNKKVAQALEKCIDKERNRNFFKIEVVMVKKFIIPSIHLNTSTGKHTTHTGDDPRFEPR